METLNKKIDFTLIFEVKNANPNGDPLNGNRPRMNIEDLGEVSDVCLKRKIRNRLQQEGNKIFIQSQDATDDDYASLADRFMAFAKEENLDVSKKTKQLDIIRQKVCANWIDVRTFGQVFAMNSLNGFSLGVRGCMSIQPAFSVDPVEIESMQITKSVNSDTKEGAKSSDTMGLKHYLNYGLYRTNGSINTHFAEKNGFTEEDALKIKDALKTLFENDVSAARPEGSMRVVKLIWWEHDNYTGQLPSAKLFDSVKIKRKDGVEIAHSLDDYEITIEPNDLVKYEMVVDVR